MQGKKKKAKSVKFCVKITLFTLAAGAPLKESWRYFDSAVQTDNPVFKTIFFKCRFAFRKKTKKNTRSYAKRTLLLVQFKQACRAECVCV